MAKKRRDNRSLALRFAAWLVDFAEHSYYVFHPHKNAFWDNVDRKHRE
jgi:hypothetical protein